jgi:predicted Na+-dependent transporter
MSRTWVVIFLNGSWGPAAAAELITSRGGLAIRRSRALLERMLLALVVAAAILGWAVPGPARSLDRHQAINAVLAVLVFASATTVPAGVAGRLRALAPRLSVVVITTAVTLPAAAFALSRLVGAGPLRDGVLAAGVAPAEVASVAITGIAGGEAAVAAVLLVASTLICVAAAGPILSAAGGAGVPAGHVLATLAVVVGLPLLAGLLLRRLTATSGRAVAAGSRIGDGLAAGGRAGDGFQALAIAAVIILVWLVSGQVRLSAAYAALVAVLVALIVTSAAIGLLLARGLPRPARIAVLLSVSMRDFAVASGIAVAAFGPAAAAPLGIYGVLVMAWGALAARLAARPPP